MSARYVWGKSTVRWVAGGKVDFTRFTPYESFKATMFMQLRGYTGYKVENGKYIGTGSYASMPSNATGGTQSDNLSGIPCTPPVVGGTAYPYLIKDTGSTIMLAPKSTSPGLIWGMRGPFSNYNGNESDDIICKNTEKFITQGGTSICDTEAYYSYTPPEARPGDDVEIGRASCRERVSSPV